MASFDRKATDKQRSEKKQTSKVKSKLKPVAKEKYKGRFQSEY